MFKCFCMWCCMSCDVAHTLCWCNSYIVASKDSPLKHYDRRKKQERMRKELQTSMFIQWNSLTQHSNCVGLVKDVRNTTYRKGLLNLGSIVNYRGVGLEFLVCVCVHVCSTCLLLCCTEWLAVANFEESQQATDTIEEIDSTQQVTLVTSGGTVVGLRVNDGRNVKKESENQSLDHQKFDGNQWNVKYCGLCMPYRHHSP